MTITNNAGLPEPIIRALENDSYSKGDADYSCSELVNPPRITLLRQRHKAEITEDAADLIWSLLGKLGHKLAEQAGAENALLEERLFLAVGDRRVSGQSDVAQWVYEDGKITDYKFTSVWTAIFGDRLEEWEQQQNIYAELFAAHGFQVNALEICAIYRDWRPSEAKQRSDYPPRAQTIPLRLWSQEERQRFIRDRLAALVRAEALPDDQLPRCSAAEMWEKPTTWAVKKSGRKTALRVLSSEAEAMEWMKANSGEFIEKRPGSRPRCEEYCPVNRWCNAYAEYCGE